MPNEESLFSRIRDALVSAGKDAANLDVVTLTGEINISSSVEDNSIKLKKLFEVIQDNAKTDTDLEVVAYTHVDLDSDSIHFVSKKSPPETLLTAHNDAVLAAQATRQGIVEMAISMFNK
ncbi:MAG: hypothetical protein GY856_51050 [bacterium]|nr:hypothetical protein [bacterium]